MDVTNVYKTMFPKHHLSYSKVVVSTVLGQAGWGSYTVITAYTDISEQNLDVKRGFSNPKIPCHWREHVQKIGGTWVQLERKLKRDQYNHITVAMSNSMFQAPIVIKVYKDPLYYFSCQFNLLIHNKPL